MQKNNFKVEEYHIGKEIEKEVRKQYVSIDAFAKALHRERQTVYDIFKRPHIATDRLVEVSRLLKRDFFKDLSDYCLEDTILSEIKNEESIVESISQLMPEDELQIIKPSHIGDVVDEYFLTNRTKPLVVFYDNATYSITDVFHKVCENILGVGMIKTKHIRYENLLRLDATIRLLSDIPQKAIEIYYDNSDLDGYDEIIVLAEKLVSVSGKFVVLYCNCVNSLYCDQSSNIRYTDLAERCFMVWHNRVHIFVADNMQNDFARRQEIYNASMPIPCGYIDRTCRLLKKGEFVAARKELEKAFFKRSTYSVVKHEDINNETHRFYVTTAIPTEEEKELLKKCKIEPCLSMWFDLSKTDGEIIAYGI